MRRPYRPNSPARFFYDNGRSRNHWLEGHCPDGQCTLVQIGPRIRSHVQVTTATICIVTCILFPKHVDGSFSKYSFRVEAFSICGFSNVDFQSWLSACVMFLRVFGLTVGLIVLLAPTNLSAGEARPGSILVLDQTDMRGSFYYQIFAAFQAEARSSARSHLSIYAEDLDLERFDGQEYEASLKQMLSAKYRDKPVGVLVVLGSCALELILHWRDELWPGIPIVFAMVNETDFKRLKPPPDVTGSVVGVKFSDSIRAARAVVP